MAQQELYVRYKVLKLWKPQYRKSILIEIKHADALHDYCWGSEINISKHKRSKLREDFEKIIVFYDAFQNQEEIACTILNPFILHIFDTNLVFLYSSFLFFVLTTMPINFAEGNSFKKANSSTILSSSKNIQIFGKLDLYFLIQIVFIFIIV